MGLRYSAEVIPKQTREILLSATKEAPLASATGGSNRLHNDTWAHGSDAVLVSDSRSDGLDIDEITMAK